MCSALRFCLPVYFDLSPLGMIGSCGARVPFVTLVAKRLHPQVVPVQSALTSKESLSRVRVNR
jgi:hypothetical protein